MYHPRARMVMYHTGVFRASSSRLIVANIAASRPRTAALVFPRSRARFWFSRIRFHGAFAARGGVATSAPGGEKSAKLMANAGSPSGTVSAPSQSDAPGNANILPT